MMSDKPSNPDRVQPPQVADQPAAAAQTAACEAANWGDFVQRCDNCRNCDLGSSRTNCVVWRGALPAPLMLVGEGPGAQEDLEGKPFVGQSGQLLDLLLQANGLTEQQLHVCNIVKCRPPGNRQPSEEEAQACRPLFREQFLFVRPKVILLLGATAYRYFTGRRDGITKVRGQWIENNGYFIMPTLHPAYVLRDNRQRDKIWADVCAVRLKLEALGLLEPLQFVPAMPQGRKKESN